MTSALRQAFDSVLAGHSLDTDDAERAIGEMLDGEAPEALVAGFLVALKMKGEAAGELAGGARAMRARAHKLDLHRRDLLDVVGTGGDKAGTFNISTGAALIAAAAGVPVAKHGNRAITGSVGAADALEQMGVAIDPGPAALQRCLDAASICFIFAPSYHPALARLGPLRRALGTRTLFNLIAPLSNPAFVRRLLVGVADGKLVEPAAEALRAIGVDHAMVVHGEDGLDEISISGATFVVEIVPGGEIRRYTIAPQEFDIRRGALSQLRSRDAAGAAAVLRSALGGGVGMAQDVLALNGGAAIYVGGAADSLKEGVARARQLIESGSALEVVEKMRRASVAA